MIGSAETGENLAGESRRRTSGHVTSIGDAARHTDLILAESTLDRQCLPPARSFLPHNDETPHSLPWGRERGAWGYIFSGSLPNHLLGTWGMAFAGATAWLVGMLLPGATATGIDLAGAIGLCAVGVDFVGATATGIDLPGATGPCAVGTDFVGATAVGKVLPGAWAVGATLPGTCGLCAEATPPRTSEAATTPNKRRLIMDEISC